MALRIQLNPKVEVVTSVGPLFVYEPGHDAVRKYAKQPAADARTHIRELLSASSSTEERKSWDAKVPFLSAEQARTLTDDDIERMAAAHREIWSGAHYISSAAKASPPVRRGADESSVAFLDRLVRWQSAQEDQQIAKLKSDMTGRGTAARLLEEARQVRQSFE